MLTNSEKSVDENWNQSQNQSHTVFDFDTSITRKEKCRKIVRRKIPILKWFPQYRREWKRNVVADVIAGFTVWLCAIPAAMGEAAIAGLSPEYGLYSAYVGAFIYLFVGSVKELVIGPQAVISLLAFQTCHSNNPECVILVGFYSGVFHLLFGVLHLGFLVSFISEPVTVGFTAAAALLIVSGQVKGFLGIKGVSTGDNLIPVWTHITNDFDTIQLGDSILGVSCIIFLVTLFKLKDIPQLARWKKYLHILSLARNALVMIICILLGYLVFPDEESGEKAPFYMVGNIPSGFPDFDVPHFRLHRPVDTASKVNATDTTERMTEVETLKYLSTGPLVIAFIGILQNVAIGKKFNGKVDATQELIALGVVNLVGSGFFDAIPCSASFSRSAVNGSSGVKSHFSNTLSGLLMLLAIGFLAPSFKYIPKTTLASIMIAAMIFMIDFGTMWRLWKLSKLDFLSCMITLVASALLGMQYGILIGVGLSILIILLKSLRPTINTEYRHHLPSKTNYVFIETDQGLNFPSASYIVDQVTKKSKPPINKFKNQTSPPISNSNLSTIEQIGNKNGTLALTLAKDTPVDFSVIDFPIIVLSCGMWTKYDYTTLNAVVQLVDNLNKQNVILIFYQIPAVWPDLLQKFGLEHPLVATSMSELDGILMELSHFFIGPQRSGLRQVISSRISPSNSSPGSPQDGASSINMDENGNGSINSNILNKLNALSILQSQMQLKSGRNRIRNSLPSSNVNSQLNHRTIAGGEIERAKARERFSFNYVRKKYSVQVEA